jgi:hypothetical protein
MGRDPEYLRFIRNVASAIAAAGTPDVEPSARASGARW